MKNAYFCAEKSSKYHKQMKKTTLILASLMMLFALKVNAQNERVLLLESFTNTGCGPCAQYNPAMDALIANNAGKIAAIKYHVNWPSSNDPMFLHNTGENSARTSYYGVNSVPHVVIDGNRFSDNPGNLNQSIINQLSVLESPMEMRLTYEVDEVKNIITVYVMGRASVDLTGSLKLYVGVIEKEIHFTSAPGPNGERDFYSVMKKMLPTSTGTVLAEMAAGDYFTYTFTWELANIYNMDQLDAIAWVQNTGTKEVYQACKSSQDFAPFYANEACVSGLSNIKSVTCSGVETPKVVLSNYGSNTLTSTDLEVFVNGELINTVSWNGNLPCLASETVDLGEITFPVEDQNLLEVKLTNVNGEVDEAPANDVTSFTIAGSPDIVGKTLKLTVRTDANPEETTWKVTHLGTGEVGLEGGPYDTPNHNYTETLVITGDGCYDFTIYDAGGNGLTGSGIYGLKAGSTTVFSGKSFKDSESNEFSYEVTADVEETLNATTAIYPNPTTGIVNIESDGEQMVTIYNMAGQRVYEGMSSGNLQIDMKAYGTGIYAIQVGEETQRVVVK